VGTLVEVNPAGPIPPSERRKPRNKRPQGGGISRSESAPRHEASSDGARGQFETEASRVLAALSKALSQLFSGLSEPIERARHVENALGIDYTLAWRTFRLATAANPVALGAEVPRPGPMARFLDAAERRHAKPAHIKHVREAYADFEALVRRHAGDATNSGRGGGKKVGGRAVFDALIGNIDGASSPKLELVHRRAAYKSTGYLWGIQAQTTLLCGIVHAGSEPNAVDAVMMGDFIGLHALRKNVPLRVTLRGTVFETSDPASVSAPALVPGEPHLLTEFSSHPLPRFESHADPRGWVETCMRFERIGKAASVNVLTAQLFRNANNGVHEEWQGLMKAVTVPSEVLLLDLLVPKGWTDPTTLRTTTHGDPALLEDLPRRVPDLELPFKERAERLGADLELLDTPDVPRYPAMVWSVLETLGWAETTFDIYRCRVQYPMLQTLVHMRVDMMNPTGTPNAL
jgi:hypothetical protein